MADLMQKCALPDRASFPHGATLIVIVANIVTRDYSIKQAACDFLQEPWPVVGEVTSEYAKRNSVGIGAAKCGVPKNEVLLGRESGVEDKTSHDWMRR